MDLVIFILCSYGLTQILCFSKVLNSFRPSHYFFSCPMCVGFWAGVLLMLLNPFTKLFTFDVSVINALLMGCISSGTSYALCGLIGDGGLQHEHRTTTSMDTQVDVETSNQLLQG